MGGTFAQDYFSFLSVNQADSPGPLLPAEETMRVCVCTPDPPLCVCAKKIMRCLHMLEGSFTHKLPSDVDWISVTRLKKEMKAAAQERVTVEEKIVACD